MCIDQAANYARAGRSVAWFDMRYSTGAINVLADMLHSDSTRVRRANGSQRIDTEAGGSITFHSARAPHSIRGRQVDLVVLPDWELIQDEDFMADLLPAFLNNDRPRIAVMA